MIEDILNNPSVEEYLVEFRRGETLCREGKDSQDLFILVDGRVEILKGMKPISETGEKGVVFGEISFILGSKRTASVRARTDVKAIRIPKEKIDGFLKQFPSMAWHLLRLLARRLDARTQSLFAFKEFCDQLPDAVVATERDGKIVSWNQSAEMLFGRTWDQMQQHSLEELYENSEAITELTEDLREGRTVKEKVLDIRRSTGEVRHVATSTSALYDGMGNFAGLLSLSRDVTETQKIQRRYRRIRFWMFPLVMALCFVALFLLLASPHLKESSRIIDIKQQALRDQVANDVLLLESLLRDSLAWRDTKKMDQIFKKFYDVQEKTRGPYTGVLLLDIDKRVIADYPMASKARKRYAASTSYGGISFEKIKGSPHYVLVVYRTDSEHPGGKKGIEIAFEMTREEWPIGWLVLQLDVDRLEDEFNADETTLRLFKF